MSLSVSSLASPPGTRPRWTKGVVLFAMVFPFLAAYFQYVLMFQDESVRWVYTINKCVQFLLPVGFWKILRVPLRWPSRPSARQIWLGLGSGLVCAAIILSAYWVFTTFSHLLDHTPESVALRLHSLGVHSASIFLFYAFFLSLIHSGLEEYYWRAFVFKEARGFVPLAYPVSALAFTLHHIILIQQYAGSESEALVVLLCLAVFVAGWFWAFLYEKTRNIYVGWISHAFADLAIMWIGLRMFQQVRL